MNIFAVVTKNLDTSEDAVISTYHKLSDKAFEHASRYSLIVSGKGIIEDKEGVLEDYEGKLLRYYDCYHNPAIYHKSYYGNYRCVTFVKTIIVED